jgi:rhodanese-related sulfurtransferase
MSNPSSEQKFMERGELRERLNRGKELVLIDVRSTEEFATGHIDGAVNIPASELPMRIGEIPSKAIIVTVCNFGGARSCGAAEQLQRLGYSSALPLRGGMRGWQDDQGGDLAK